MTIPSFAGGVLGTPMSVLGKPLNSGGINAYLLKIMKPERGYTRQELIEKVVTQHQQAGGLPVDASSRITKGQFKKALNTLKKQGLVVNPERNHWRLAKIDPETLDALPVEYELEAEAARLAEVRIGDGAEAVYGWYFPAYRKLADLEGADRWPIKVGSTARDVHGRLDESVGMAPERPALGFVLRVDRAGRWERFIQSALALDGQKIEDAIGDEWFNTSLTELQNLVSEKMAKIKAQENSR